MKKKPAPVQINEDPDVQRLNELYQGHLYNRWITPSGYIAAKCELYVICFYKKDGQIKVRVRIKKVLEHAARKTPEDKIIHINYEFYFVARKLQFR